MNIIILGAGQVGSTVAYHLAQEEANEITIVDRDKQALSELQDRLDVRTVEGHASYPRVLERAGANDADMIIALTDSDEINMIACQVAYTIFHTPTKIARIRAPEYLRRERLFSQEALPVDVHISPEKLVTKHIQQLIQYPGASQVFDFADGKVRLVGLIAHEGGLLVGQPLKIMKEHLPNVDSRVAAIYRDGESIRPDGDTIIQEGDEVFFFAARRDIRVVMSELMKLENPVRRVTIAGGGNIGYNLARSLERTNHVKLIERDRDTAKRISEKLPKTIVLSGDAADHSLLTEENIDAADVYCAVTNSEEINILSAMQAKKMGAKKVIALVNRPTYVDLIEEQAIDIAISPQQITLGALLAHVRRGDVIKVHSLKRGAAEAMEAIAHGDKRTSKVVGKAIENIDLPDGVEITGVVRGDEVIMAHHDTVIHADDHVILYISNCKQTREVEKLFQVGVTFV